MFFFKGGIMFWSIDNDDFRGLCTGEIINPDIATNSAQKHTIYETTNLYIS